MSRPALPPGPYLLVGLARSGQAAALALRARGESVIGLDAGRPDGVERLADAGVELHLAGDDWDGAALAGRFASLVKSPGVPADVPAIERGRAAGAYAIGELELAWRLLGNEFVAVTGTNGKTTTVELIGHIHRTAGAAVAVAGNVGTALSSLVGAIDARATVVCEASSFQLEDAVAFAPEVAVLLNIAPDHLDRHGTLERYAQAKLRIFANQRPENVAILPVGLDFGPTPTQTPIPGAASRVRFGERPDADLALAGGWLLWRGERLLAAEQVRIPGRHNLDNAMAAAAACLARGMDVEAVRAGLRSFPGVAHRLEPIGERGGVRYFNDSKATNVASTLVALEAMAPAPVVSTSVSTSAAIAATAPEATPATTPAITPATTSTTTPATTHTTTPAAGPAGHSGAPDRRVHLILGGQGKGQDFAPLGPAAARACRAVYLIGEDAPTIAAALAVIADVPVLMCATLEVAVDRARERARPGELVLLSPACASFDQFADFEARGERFRELARRA